MNYRHNFEHCFAEKIGKSGLSSSHFESLLSRAKVCIRAISDKEISGVQPLIDQVFNSDDLQELEEVAEKFCNQFDDVVVLGTGASSLGGKTLSALASSGFSNSDAIDPSLFRPKLHFLENVDPDSFERLFNQIELSTTGFLVISKSGSTSETMAQLVFAIDVFRNVLGISELEKHFVSLTESGDRPLRAISNQHNIQVIDLPADVGGRFSAFSAAGLLPAMIVGLDGESFRSGAASVIERIFDCKDPLVVPPAVGASLSVGLSQQNGIVANVLMSYLDRLEYFGKWYRQLWAESLGKEGKGTIPLDALGTTDQHSQLQLYLEGPKNKFFTLIFSKTEGKGGILHKDLANLSSLDYMAGKRVGDLMAAEQRATFETLVKNHCPTRYIEITHLDEYLLGTLMMHFMLETIISAYLMNINPFDQPAVEEGKLLARRLLRKGKH